MSRTRLIIAGGAAAVGITLGAAAIASAGTTQTNDEPAAENDDAQEPDLNGSVQAPEGDEGTSEADESKALESLATITADEAIAAATDAVPGTADAAELENENGSVVYEVEVTGDDGSTSEVKVDAGNGAVLDTEAEDDEAEDDESGEEADDDENEGDEADEADETDEADEGAETGK